MSPTVYVGTTIPSYYFDARPSIAADIERTRVWWDVERFHYECFISGVVLDELSEGSYPAKSDALRLVSELPILANQQEIAELAKIYQLRKVMPRPPVRDALHVAAASYYRMEYMLTWNCQHVANANKMKHLQTINFALGYPLPRICTPNMLTLPEE
jgi:hypothetical protein